MNCKLKLHSRGFGAEPVLKFLQTLVLDFPHICLHIFPEILVGGKKHFCRQMYRKF